MSTIADIPATWKRQFRETNIRIDTAAEADAVWVGPYADLPAFLVAVGGITQVVGGASRIVPLIFPDLALPEMYAYRIEAKGIGHNQIYGEGGTYSHCRVKVAFKNFPYTGDGDIPYASIELQQSGRQLNGPASGFIFTGGVIRPIQDIGWNSAGFTMAITFYRLPSLNYAKYALYAGTTNNGVFLGIAAGSLLYRGPSASGSQNVAGVPSYNVTHIFEYSYIPWNFEPLPGTGVPTLCTLYGGVWRYPAISFPELFNN